MKEGTWWKNETAKSDSPPQQSLSDRENVWLTGWQIGKVIITISRCPGDHKHSLAVEYLFFCGQRTKASSAAQTGSSQSLTVAERSVVQRILGELTSPDPYGVIISAFY